MDFKCNHCEKDFQGAISWTGTGWTAKCPFCGETINVEVPKGRFVIAFSEDCDPEKDKENFTDNFPGPRIRTYHAFETADQFIEFWKKLSEDPEGMWYWCVDLEGEPKTNGFCCFCSGACDPDDLTDSFLRYPPLEYAAKKALIEEAAEELGWSTSYHSQRRGGKEDAELECYVEFSCYSPAGEDVGITEFFEDPAEISVGLYERYRDFDINEYVSRWLDAKEHGDKSVPDVETLVEDGRWQEQAILDLSNAIRDKINGVKRDKSKDAYKFTTEIITHVPTCALIEDYQALQKAVNTCDWDEVKTVMECLAASIGRYTDVPKCFQISPSPSSLVAMSCESGILVTEDEKDFSCAAGLPVSRALSGGACQCDASCMTEHGCCPEEGKMLLQCGFTYDMERSSSQDDELLEALDEAKEKIFKEKTTP